MFKVQIIFIFIFLFALSPSILKASSIYDRNGDKTKSNKERSNVSSCGAALINPYIPYEPTSLLIETLHSLIETATHNGYSRHIGDIDKFRRLLERIDVNLIKYVDDVTLLHIMTSHFSLETLEVVINAGASLNARNSFGNTPLHDVQTAENGRALLRAGADPNIKNNHGAIPLHYAFPDMTEVLVKDPRVDVNTRDKFGYTPLDYAVNRTIQLQLVTEVRSRKDGMGQHYLGNRFQTFFIQLDMTLGNPTRDSEWMEKIKALIDAGAIVTTESSEVSDILNILTSTRQL